MAHTGPEIIRQHQLKADAELVRYRLDLATVRETCQLCRIMVEEGDRNRSSYQRRHGLF